MLRLYFLLFVSFVVNEFSRRVALCALGEEK